MCPRSPPPAIHRFLIESTERHAFSRRSAWQEPRPPGSLALHFRCQFIASPPVLALPNAHRGNPSCEPFGVSQKRVKKLLAAVRVSRFGADRLQNSVFWHISSPF